LSANALNGGLRRVGVLVVTESVLDPRAGDALKHDDVTVGLVGEDSEKR
jgi:hypothetical protein